MTACPHCARYREERDAAVEEALQLRAIALGEGDYWDFLALGMTPTEARILCVLVARHVATKDALMTALYADDPGGGPESNALHVFISHVRKKLRRRGVSIETVACVGWALSSEMKARLKALMRPQERQSAIGSREARP